ncbi:MAG: phosphoadenylyl-sulfate reductase [Bacteroidetes bacterium]|nr:phosphoadenylyl-sulfate reductase [Bacteroidota bacterium]
MHTDKIQKIEKLVSGKTSEESLALLSKEFSGRIVFSTSFGLEDQAITHMIFSNNLQIKIFTLDTGRIFPETYSVWNSTREKYGKEIEAFSPNADAVQKMVSAKGPNSFYDSVENRLECCRIRKVEPLHCALKGNEVWITGIRKDQSPNRENLSSVEWDEKNQIVKFHPLFDWSFDKVKSFVKKNNAPYNSLHDKGFPSIGCQPCTRAVKEGEDPRAGRWWWENTDKKECGLHVS